ncbi:myotubularin-like phosphatases II superfamily [Actinidia rufa]|uniref:Myotubularin-like phosphatases II superfamily n=1 Tax=Actinidia rufa TaxID=165716 RepID=A0A7J0GLJ5_9ERIC|nr:myotubularin-like phosphatases II superfamily [Actinidia rufa]
MDLRGNEEEMWWFLSGQKESYDGMVEAILEAYAAGCGESLLGEVKVVSLVEANGGDTGWHQYNGCLGGGRMFSVALVSWWWMPMNRYSVGQSWGGKDMRIIVFGFRPRTKQRRAVFDALLRCTRPARLWDLYAFTSGPSKFSNTNPVVRLLNEYFRLLGMVSYHASTSIIEDGSFTLSNEWWRISAMNSNYSMCPTYPFALLVPKCISDEEVLQASTFRGRCRLPVISWCRPGNGAVLARSSQPLVGLMMNMRSNADEKLVASLCTHLAGAKQPRRVDNVNSFVVYCLLMQDLEKNALANGAMGGGSESSSNYFQSEIVFFGIDNIHAMRDSLSRLRDYLDTYGATSSDGMSSFLRHGGWTWGGGNLSSMSASVSTLGDSGWLIHVQNVLAGSAWIAARVALESASVLVHCSDGWDRTSQLVSLASLMLDPYYRTFKGFQAVVEKDWLAFGHPFSDRVGMPTLSGSGSVLYELSRQSSTGSFPSSPMRQASGSFTSQAQSSSHAQTSNNYSPIFLQWVDCVSQLLRMYPFAFEFSSAFLVDFLDCMLSSRFGNFLCNRFGCSVSGILCKLDIEKAYDHVNWESCGWRLVGGLQQSGPYSWATLLCPVCFETVWGAELGEVGVDLGCSDLGFYLGSLAGWKRHYLFMGGRLTSVKSTLSSLAACFMLVHTIPMSMARRFEKLQLNFLLVNRVLVCSSIQKMGWELEDLAVYNKALVGEWLWRFASMKIDEFSKHIPLKVGSALTMDSGRGGGKYILGYWVEERFAGLEEGEKERQQSGISNTCGCLWMYLADLRASEGSSHVHYNLFYDPSKHEGPLLPPAAALAPTLWPQFHLRWACPSEAQAGEVEAHCRSLSKKLSELQKEKEVAESKAKEITATMESLTAALQNEKQNSSSAMNLAKRASKESAAIKRAIQSLGCKVHFSGCGDCTVDIERNPTEIPQNFMQSPSKRELDSTTQNDEKSDLSVSITVMADDTDSNNPIGRVCESLCPLRTRDGGCRWPDAGCAQLGSQFVGLKANFDAFDRLSIYDSYFRSE